MSVNRKIPGEKCIFLLNNAANASVNCFICVCFTISECHLYIDYKAQKKPGAFRCDISNLAKTFSLLYLVRRSVDASNKSQLCHSVLY
jgi:hypothetical protein